MCVVCGTGGGGGGGRGRGGVVICVPSKLLIVFSSQKNILQSAFRSIPLSD